MVAKCVQTSRIVPCFLHRHKSIQKPVHKKPLRIHEHRCYDSTHIYIYIYTSRNARRCSGRLAITPVQHRTLTPFLTFWLTVLPIRSAGKLYKECKRTFNRFPGQRLGKHVPGATAPPQKLTTLPKHFRGYEYA
jgi:hypothetical protein